MNPLDPGYYTSEELRTFGFKAVGENVRISRDCTVIGPERIVFGDNVRIDSGTALVATGGTLTFEGLNHIGGQCHFCVVADLAFAELSGTSQGVRIYTASDDYSGRSMMGPMVPADLRRPKIAPIRLSRHVAIGSGSVILPGANVREGSVVGSLSLVHRTLAPWGIYHGNPAKRLRERNRDIEELERVMKARLAPAAMSA